jgi:hypothetical protein
MYANLTDDGEQIITGNDSIVIVDNFQSIRGGRTLNVLGYAPKVIQAGHVIIKETSTGNYKPMPATENETDAVATLGTVIPGSGYTNGTYENVPLQGGSGTGVLATVVVASTVVSTITKTFGGNNYKVGDALTVPAAFVGGTGDGLGGAPVATIAAVTGAYGALPSGHTYAGILIATIRTKKPFAGIMVRGTVNPACTPYSMTSILAAVKTALPLIDFRQD